MHSDYCCWNTVVWTCNQVKSHGSCSIYYLCVWECCNKCKLVVLSVFLFEKLLFRRIWSDNKRNNWWDWRMILLFTIVLKEKEKMFGWHKELTSFRSNLTQAWTKDSSSPTIKHTRYSTWRNSTICRFPPHW